jgi:hypothetical protein
MSLGTKGLISLLVSQFVSLSVRKFVDWQR